MRSVSARVLVLTLSALAFPGAAFAGSPGCSQVQMPVALAPGGPTNETVTGTLCAPSSGGALQILLSGATYGRVYSDFGYQPATYSYVRAMTAAGLSTLNIDRLGLGASSQPAAADLTVAAHAFVVHQVVAAARSGTFGSPYADVVTVGHSLGSAVAIVEAARYKDVDGVIASGFLPHAPPFGGPIILASLYAAQLDAATATAPAGYVTTRPGTRGPAFYREAGADPLVIASDEASKQTASPFEIATLADAASPEAEQGLDVPVLWAIGEFDNVFCPSSCADPGSAAHQEEMHYPNLPCSAVHVQGDTGHVLNLHPSAPAWFGAARAWVTSLIDGVPGCP